jgi:hypothetical protein
MQKAPERKFGMSKDRPVTLQELTEELNLGEQRGSYPLDGVVSALSAFGLRVLTALWLAGFIGIIAAGSGAVAYGRVAIVGAAVLALYGARAGAHWLTRRYSRHRVLLYSTGLVKTDWTGRPRDWVQWADVSGVTSRRTMMAGVILAVWAVKLRQADGGAVRVTALGLKPRFLRDLDQVMIAAQAAAKPA